MVVRAIMIKLFGEKQLYTMPDCVMVARQTLTLFVWVRILVGQPTDVAAFLPP